MNTDNIRGKVVVITGASSGLGDATARTSPSAALRRPRRAPGHRLQTPVDEITRAGGHASALATDVSARDLRRTSAGGQAVESPHDDHLARRGRDGAPQQHH